MSPASSSRPMPTSAFADEGGIRLLADPGGTEPPPSGVAALLLCGEEGTGGAGWRDAGGAADGGMGAASTGAGAVCGGAGWSGAVGDGSAFLGRRLLRWRRALRTGGRTGSDGSTSSAQPWTTQLPWDFLGVHNCLGLSALPREAGGWQEISDILPVEGRYRTLLPALADGGGIGAIPSAVVVGRWAGVERVFGPRVPAEDTVPRLRPLERNDWSTNLVDLTSSRESGKNHLLSHFSRFGAVATPREPGGAGNWARGWALSFEVEPG
mmetsp:Transcript_35707/g.81447  ORF Transcript_35707/g.81447 Transcript_35707/m.81447 type:complete len:267 (-) Transcript_35707:481-1281(-)